MGFKNIVCLIVILVSMSGCALWPYKKDFDCPVEEGIKCKSLYEISEMADQGLFGPNAPKNIDKKYIIKKVRREYCHECR